MKLFRDLKRKIKNIISPGTVMGVSQAYDLWATDYDDQPDNPVVYLNENLFSELINNVIIEGKTIVDIGCGTGKHWRRIFSKKPASLIGYDISAEMLNQLRGKYPAAQTYIARDNKLGELESKSCDLVISTLVIGHIAELQKALSEWNRVLKKGGEIIITDFHPEALQNGAYRSFTHNNKLINIETYVYPISQVKELAKELDWQLLNLKEKRIDDSVLHFFKKRNSEHVYKKAYNTPLVYGCHFKKTI